MSDYKCRDCNQVVSLPVSYAPEYKRRVVDIASHQEGESMWDRETRHLCILDLSDFEDTYFATCRKYGTGERITLAMIRRELESDK
jgi:hypothetical protein